MPIRKKKLVIRPQYYIQDDCWGIVKEYAGIYNWTTAWNKLERIGVDTLHVIFKKHFNRRLTNIHSNTKKVRTILLKNLFSRRTKDILNDLYNTFKPKPYKAINTSFLDNVKVGDEVIYKYWLGKIVKINKTSVSWQRYTISHEISDNPNAFMEQTYDNIKCYYDKTLRDKAIAIRDFRMPYDRELEYREHCVDYGR
jgi:hypothetical protein